MGRTLRLASKFRQVSNLTASCSINLQKRESVCMCVYVHHACVCVRECVCIVCVCGERRDTETARWLRKKLGPWESGNSGHSRPPCSSKVTLVAPALPWNQYLLAGVGKELGNWEIGRGGLSKKELQTFIKQSLNCLLPHPLS